MFRNKEKSAEVYGAPGAGNSINASIASVVLVFAAWMFCTHPIFAAYEITPVLDEQNSPVLDADGEEIIQKKAVLDDNGNPVKAPLIKPLFLPSPPTIAKRFVRLLDEEFSGGTILRHIWESVKRVYGAFVFGVLVAVPLGILMAINRYIRGFFDPIIEFYRPIPPLAYLPLMIVWFGIGETTKVLVILLAVFAPMVLSARAGVRSVPIEQIHAAYSMGATRMQVIFLVILKGALPEILTGMRISMAFGWTTVVAAELAAAQAGLGAMIKAAADFLVTDVVIVGIVVIGVIAYSSDLLVRWAERLLVPWKGRV